MVQKRVLRNAVVFGPVVQLLIVYAASSQPIPPAWFYVIFLSLLFVPVYLYERDNPRERVIETSQYSLLYLPSQATTGLAVGLAISLPVVFLGTFTAGPGTASELVFQVLAVSFVETVYLIVVVKTMWIADFPLGAVAWPVLFGFLHVRVQVLGGDFSLTTGFRFVYSAFFGVLFYVLYAAREWHVGEGPARHPTGPALILSFGLVFVAIVVMAHNALVSGFQQGWFAWGDLTDVFHLHHEHFVVALFALAAYFGIRGFRRRPIRMDTHWFGAVTSWTAHLTINAFVILFPLVLMGFSLEAL